MYGDQTGWRQRAATVTSGASAPKVRYFLYRSSRGGPVVEEVLGDEFEGVGQRLLRSLDVGPTCCGTSTNKERFPEHEGLARWSQRVREVYDQAQAYPGPDPELPKRCGVPAGEATAAVPRATMVHLPAPPGQRYAQRVLCQRVERFLPELFTFIAEPRASADNNAAERSLRPPVVSRKISGGTRERKRDQEHPGFSVRHLAPARTQPLPCPQFHPLPITCSSLNSYRRRRIVWTWNSPP